MILFIKTLFWFFVFKFQELGTWIASRYKIWINNFIHFILAIAVTIFVLFRMFAVCTLIGLLIRVVYTWSLSDFSSQGVSREILAYSFLTGALCVIGFAVTKENFDSYSYRIFTIMNFLESNWKKARERAQG